MALILSRKIGEEIVINGNIVVRVVEIHSNRCKIAVECPKEIPVHRKEIQIKSTEPDNEVQ